MKLVRLEDLQQFTAVNVLSDGGAIGGPVVIPQAAQIILTWQLTNGRSAVNVLYGRYSGTYPGSTTVANAIKSGITTGALWTAMAAHLATGAGLMKVGLRDVNTVSQPLVESSATVVPGTSTGSALPDEVAICITLRTNLTGPGNRGRFYIPGWASTAIGTAGVIAPAAVTAAQNWADGGVRVTINANQFTMVLGQQARQAYTGSTGTQHPARAAATLPINGCFCRDNHWDTIRKRGLK